MRSTLNVARRAHWLLWLLCLTACAGGGDSGSSTTSASAPASSFTVGGTVSGLSGTLRLTNNGGDLLIVTQNGSFTFSKNLSNAAAYNVVVTQQPDGATCTVSRGQGTVSTNVSNISVACTSNQPGGPPLTGLPSSGIATVTLTSDPQDLVGQGKSYGYSSANSSIRVTTSSNWFAITIDGTDNWAGWLQLPPTSAQFAPGTYSNLYQYLTTNQASFDWSGNNRFCLTLGAEVTINSATYVAGVLTAIDFNFDQYCFMGTVGLHGHVVWQAAGTTITIAPVTPPVGLWQPAADATPASGNYLYLESNPTDYIGNGGTYIETPTNSLFTVQTTTGGVEISISGAHSWNGQLQAMVGLSQLQPGYYGQLRRYGFLNPARGGISWGGEERGCNTSMGWFVIDGVSYSDSVLTALDLRFEQDCEISTAALHGQLHWRADDTSKPPGPSAPPAGLWQPAVGATPTSGNYVYLSSDAGDYVGTGLFGPATEYVYTEPASTISVTPTGSGIGPNLTVVVNGISGWIGEFGGMYSISSLEPGYYGPLTTIYDPSVGLMGWSGMGRGCNDGRRWFVIDSISYSGNLLTGVDLRFEQHCGSAAAALHGKIHWIRQ